MTAMQNEAAAFAGCAREVRIPLAVVLQRKRGGGRWVMPQWKVFSVVAGAHLTPGASPPNDGENDDATARVIHDDGECKRVFCGGLRLHLTTDGGEGYWVNLLSDAPYLFVVCDGEQGDDEVRAAFVTANQDEANGYMEADRLVLSAPMPAAVCAAVERFVLTHYRPQVRKKRKRREWAEESVYDKRAEHADR